MKEKKNFFDRFVTVVLLAVCILLAVGIYFRSGEEKELPQPGTEQQGQEQTAVNVSAAAAWTGTFTSITKTNGEITSEDTDVGIYPDTAGKVAEMLVSKGDTVAKGDVIAYIDPSKPGSQYQLSPVISTADGIVSGVSATTGQTVGTSDALATVSGEKTLSVLTKVSVRNIGTMTEGLPATVSVAAYPDREYEAEISYIAPSVDKASRTVDVELSFTGGTDGLMEGMYASAQVTTERLENVLLIPSEAVGTYAGESVVYVVTDGVSHRQTVTVGENNGTLAVVSSGLAEGDMVVTAGNAGDGTAVNIV